MRLHLRTFCLVLLAAICSPPLFGQEPSLQERIAVRRDLEVAKMNLRHYWQIEYPRKQRELDAAIECTRAEIENNRWLLREYEPYISFSTGQPFPITIRDLRMCIRSSELRLNDLLEERNALVRFHSDQFRILAADVYEARARIADLEANMPPLTETTVQPSADR